MVSDHDHDLPPGAPRGDAEAEHLLPVWCQCGVRWEPTQAGYVPQTVDSDHPNLPCRDVGSIPSTCQPVIGYNPDDPLAVS